jgi:hypothetical protein
MEETDGPNQHPERPHAGGSGQSMLDREMQPILPRAFFGETG